jgi:hypothetical protein
MSLHVNVEAPASLLESLKIVHWFIRSYLLPFAALPLASVNRWTFHFLTLWILFQVLREYQGFTNKETTALFGIWAALAVCFMVLLNLYSETLVQRRHAAVLFLPTALLGFRVMEHSFRKRAMLILMAVLGFFYGETMIGTYAGMAKDGDWKRVASFIEQKEKAGEPILVFISESQLALKAYYRGANQIIPLPAEASQDRYHPSGQILSSQKIRGVFKEFAAGQRIWIVTHHTQPHLGVDFQPEVLEEIVRDNCTLEERREFYKTEVRRCLYRPKEMGG